MRTTIGPSALWVSAAICLSALSGCQQHVEAPKLADTAAPLPPPPPEPPPPPSADDELHTALSQLQAVPGSAGWELSLDSGKFTGLKVRFDSQDAAHLAKIVDLMKRSPNLRLQIEAYPGNRGSKSHRRELAQIHANSVLRNLIDRGADEARIQAFAADTPAAHAAGADKVAIIFSNADGEFRQAAASR
jgi:outer membrane protein OmpA-like peptidoglycan-associated protein